MRIQPIYILIIIFWSSLFSVGQEVKLGLPGGHSDDVRSAVISPNGNLVLSISDDNTAKLFELSSGKLIHTFLDSGGSAVFSPSGNQIITTSNNYNTAKLFDVFSGKLIHTFKGHTESVYHAAFSPDGKQVAINSWDDTLKIFNLLNGEILSFKGATGSVKFSPNGKHILTNSSNGSLLIFDVASEALIHKLNSDSDTLSIASFNPDGKQVIATTREGNVMLYNASNGKLAYAIKAHTDLVKSITFSPDGKKFLTSSFDKTAKLFDVVNGQLIYTFTGHSGFVNSASFSPDGKQVLTSSYDHTSKLFNALNGSLIYSFNEHKAFVNSAVFSSDGKQVLTTSYDNTAKLFDVSNGKLIRSFGGQAEDILSAVFSPDGSQILITPDYGSAKLFNLSNGTLTHTFLGEEPNVRSTDFNPDGSQILILSNLSTITLSNVLTGKITHKLIDYYGGHGIFDSAIFSPDGKKILVIVENTAKLFDALSGKLIHSFVGHTDEVNAAIFSANSKYVIISSDDKTAKLFDVFSGKLIHTYKGHTDEVNSATFSPDNKQVITTSFDASAKLFNISSGKLIYTFRIVDDSWGAPNVVFSPDGGLIAISFENTSRLFDSSSGKLIHTFKGHTDKINCSVFSSDSKQFISVSDDNSAKVFDVSSGKQVHSFNTHSGAINSMELSSNEKYLLTGSSDGSFVIQNFKSKKTLIRSFVFENDPSKWLHLHPSGLFDASPEAMKMMYWTKGLEIIEFNQLKDRYWLPGLWEKVINGEILPNVRNMSELKLQPKVEIQKITDDGVTVHLTKREGGYGKISLFINKKEAFGDIRPSDMDFSLEEQTIYVPIKDHPYLLEGENDITIKASSEDGFVQGRGSVGTAIVKKKVLTQPQFFGVVIGIGNYANDQLNLKYTINDAEAISEAMQLGAENLFSEDRTHIYTITSKTNQKPNKENIKNAFKEISTKAKAEDIITVYLSGHGITWGGNQGDFYFLTSDATATNNEAYNDPAIRENNTISTAELVDWLKEISALKQVMIIDACGSGKAVDNLIAERDIEPSQIKAIDRMKDRTGMYIISGSAADAVSYEASIYGQGLLTYSILQAMKGAALKENKYVDIFTIMDYARETVPKLAEGIGGIQKPQLLIPKGGSFDIGLLDNSDKLKIPLANPKTVFIRSTLVNADDFEDNLGLSELLNQELSFVSSKGRSSPLVYFDSAKFPNACKISGGYTNDENNNISISLKLRCGDDLKSFELNAVTKEKLIKNIIEIIDNKA